LNLFFKPAEGGLKILTVFYSNFDHNFLSLLP
jgi:hypothetical protein